MPIPETECKCDLPDDLKADPLRHRKVCPVFKAWHEARDGKFAALRREEPSDDNL